MVSEAGALVVLDGRLQQLALLDILVEELLHVGACEQVRLGYAENLERLLLRDESAPDPKPLLRHLLALLVAVLLRLLVVLLPPVVQHSVAVGSFLLGHLGLLLASFRRLVLLRCLRRLGCALRPPLTVCLAPYWSCPVGPVALTLREKVEPCLPDAVGCTGT